MKKIIELILVFLAIITTSCVTPSSTEVYDWSDDVTIPDNTGNLYIRNQTGENIVLYTYDENDILTIKKKISSDADLFLINVPNDDEIAKVLKIWLESKLDDPGSPDESKLYRQWDVVLASETTDENKRATWVITGGGGEAVSGTGYFSYPDSTPNGVVSAVYSVDVFLNNKNGAAVGSLAPGTSNKIIGLQYNILPYIVYYLYWYSDPGTYEGKTDIGWIETNDEGNPIQVIINYENSNQFIDIPIYYEPGIAGRFGKVTIRNFENQTIQIWGNNQNDSGPIEMYDVSERPPTGLSLIAAGESKYFIISENNWILTAKNVTATENIGSPQTIDIVEQYDSEWIIDLNQGNQTVEIHNNTNEDFLILEYIDEYLGYMVKSNESREITIDEAITELKAVNIWNTKTVILDSIISPWYISSLPFLKMDKQIVHVEANNDFFLNIYAEDVNDLIGTYIEVTYNKNMLQLTGITEGSFLSENNLDDTSFITSTLSESNTSGLIEINTTRLGGDPVGVSGNGIIAKLTFTAKTTTGVTNVVFSTNNTCIMRDFENNDIIYVGLMGTEVDVY